MRRQGKASRRVAKDTVFSVRLPAELVGEIDAWAKEESLSRNALIGRLLRIGSTGRRMLNSRAAQPLFEEMKNTVQEAVETALQEQHRREIGATLALSGLSRRSRRN